MEEKKHHPNWGGKRPGAGAPKGNLNAWRHGRNSRYSLQLAEFFARVPEAQEAMLRLTKRRQRREAQAQEAAAELMAEICRRVGEALLMYGPPAHPEERRRASEDHPEESKDGNNASAHPEVSKGERNDHLENNQQLIAILNTASRQFREFAAQQSREARN